MDSLTLEPLMITEGGTTQTERTNLNARSNKKVIDEKTFGEVLMCFYNHYKFFVVS